MPRSLFPALQYNLTFSQHGQLLPGGRLSRRLTLPGLMFCENTAARIVSRILFVVHRDHVLTGCSSRAHPSFLRLQEHKRYVGRSSPVF